MAGLAFSVHKFTCGYLPVYVAFALSKDHPPPLLLTKVTSQYQMWSVLTADKLGPYGFSRCSHSRMKGASWCDLPFLYCCPCVKHSMSMISASICAICILDRSRR